MESEFKIVKLRENPKMNCGAADWFHGKWGVPAEAYLQSIEECQQKKNKVPQWYVVLDGEKIVAGMGVIENDFHERKDLTPNVCAVFTEEEYRGRGLAKMLLDFVCDDMAELGFPVLYLITSHTSFYEKCGWEFFCEVKEDCGKTARMYRHISYKTLLKSFLDADGRLTAYPAKRKVKLYALIYLSKFIEKNRVYSESELNELLNERHTFADPATLRRELYNHRFIDRNADGSEYRLEEIQPTLAELEKKYG